MKYKKPAFWIILAAIVICAVVSVCFLTAPVRSTTDDIYNQRGYTILEQETVTLTLQIPTGGMSNAIYTQDGEDFETGQLDVWQEDGTTIYLSRAWVSEHTTDLVLFTFDFDYQFEEYGSFLTASQVLLPPVQKHTTSTVLTTPTNALWDSAGQVFPDALNTLGVNDTGAFALSVSKEDCKAGKGILFMDVQLNRISYTKNGHEEEAAAFFEAQANSPSDLTPGYQSADEFNFVAEILEIHEDYFLVKPETGWVLHQPELMEVPVRNIRASLAPQVGDHLIVTCDNTVWNNASVPRIANVLHMLLIPQYSHTELETLDKSHLQSTFLGSYSPGHLLISSGGQIFEPYISGTSADAVMIKPEEVKQADLLVSVPYCNDFEVIFPKGGWINTVILYDENYQRISHDWNLDFLSSLESGTYYLDTNILENQTGGERNSYSCMFELVVS